METKIRKILCMIIAFVVGAVVVSFGMFYFTTSQGSEINEYCHSNTELGATEFEVLGLSELDGYKFYVAKNQADPYQQEMFICRKELFLGIFDLDRYVIEQHIVGSKDVSISSVQFKAKDCFADRETEVILFFSANPEHISKYTINYQENGNYAELHGGVSTHEPFVIGLVELGMNDYVSRVYEYIDFYDENGELIITLGDSSRQ